MSYRKMRHNKTRCMKIDENITALRYQVLDLIDSNFMGCNDVEIAEKNQEIKKLQQQYDQIMVARYAALASNAEVKA